MAWSLDMSAELYDVIRSILEDETIWTREDLCKALADYNYDKFHGGWERPGNPHRRGPWNWEKINRSILADDLLVDAIMDAIEDVSTTSNGGWQVYINFDGWQVVDLKGH